MSSINRSSVLRSPRWAQLCRLSLQLWRSTRGDPDAEAGVDTHTLLAQVESEFEASEGTLLARLALSTMPIVCARLMEEDVGLWRAELPLAERLGVRSF